MEPPFVATYYVDPSFTGTSSGSSDSPFTTIAAAFAYALSLALTGAVIFIPPNGTVTENVVFPTSGDWEIASQGTSRTSTLSGTVSCSSSSTPIRARLTNLTVTGAVTGDAGDAFNAFLVLSNSDVNSTVTLTASGAGFWTLQCIGRCTDQNSLGGYILGATSVVGTIHANNWSFLGALAYSVNATRFYTCRIATGTITVTGATATEFSDCTFTKPLTITGSAPLSPVSMDGASLASAMSVGLTLAGTAKLRSLNANAAASTVLANNASPTVFTGKAPPGLYEAVASLDLLAPGTLGTAIVNVIYTNLSGVLTTAPVASIDITGASGSEAGAVRTFQHNGATDIKYSVSGIMTPGALQLAVAFAARLAS